LAGQHQGHLARKNVPLVHNRSLLEQEQEETNEEPIDLENQSTWKTGRPGKPIDLENRSTWKTGRPGKPVDLENSRRNGATPQTAE